MSASDLAATILSETPGSTEWRVSVATLAQMALSTDLDTAAAATRTIFADIVEPWSDGFKPDDCDRYLEFITECIVADCSPIATELNRLGLGQSPDLQLRAQSLRRAKPLALDRNEVRKAFVLSRVTLGADIAVTSVLIEAAKQAFPRAAIEFAGGSKGAAFFSGSDRVTHLPIAYSRGATLRDRLNVWLELRAAIANSTKGLRPSEFVVLDPDSRLTQLGVLPVVELETNYRFFESRGFGGDSKESIGRIAAEWCAATLPGVDTASLYPRVELPNIDLARGVSLRESSDRPLAAVSLGVGGRNSKRLTPQFEDALLKSLSVAGYGIVLDFGAGEAEELRAAERVSHFSGTTAQLADAPADLVTWQGSLSAFGGLIAACDCYVGYDSASSHLAAALGVPGVEVFAGAASDRMMQRWAPTGPAALTLIPVDAATSEESVLTAVKQAITR